VLLTEEPQRVETVNGQEILGGVQLSSSTASHQPDTVEGVQTCADQQHDDAGRVSSSPYYLDVGVEDRENEDRERDCGDDTEREIFEGDETIEVMRSAERP
jgi:hypothetical protein